MNNEKRLPGAMALIKGFISSGSHHNSWGVGSMDISIATQNPNKPWIDLIDIKFSSPTPEQMLDAETAPFGTEANKAKADIVRRLSFKQARYIQDKIIKFLNEEFKDGYIPPDDEI